ncbi:MAG: LLM class flavin-dependent oxidoreductase [Solirubrobacterales bacterium]|nr:LLM class flavin-dependent oxidoreductase [Solirubrobacterales bacterium]MCB8970892.1 LLM class flavin-dependent oxidoreductase [Thermoleophilales bacterium]MCO5326212.1 LLM class flavin-dependent oxidoreductase [Solirubrobacterales bacterium]
MDLSIGLPNAVPGTTGDDITEFARRAEARGFKSLGTIDRIVYENYEPLVALAAAAAVTERIGLLTSVLLGPLRPSGTALAKQTQSLNALSGGRFTLGIGLGGREDDYAAAGADMGTRGDVLEEMLAEMKRVWDDSDIGPNREGRPGLLIGGGVQASFERAARWGDGWIAGGAPPDQFAEAAATVKAAWSEAGREGTPRLVCLSYFALGESGEEDAQRYLTDYYGFLGAELSAMIAASAAKDAETVQGYVQAFEGVGCDELVFFPCSSDPAQVDLLADAAGL